MAKKFKPKFAGHGVEIGGPPVNSPEGKGLLQRSNSNDACCGVESQSDKDMVNHNLLSGLGDDLIETDAMCDVDENGVENKPQGVKVPGHAKPTDGYTSKLRHNHENSIAENSNPFVEKVAEMMDGGAVVAKESDCVEEEGELTMEELFESYLEECGDSMSYEGFAGHCADAGYEEPGLDNTQDIMSDHPGYVFTPVGDGLYRKEAVPQDVEIADLPGQAPMPSAAPMSSVAPVETANAPSISMGATSGPNDLGDYDELEEDNMAVAEETDNNHHPEAGDFTGKEKRVEHHSGVSKGNDFKQGAPKLSLDYSDGHGMEVSKAKGGHPSGAAKTVSEESVTTAQVASPPSTKPQIKKGKLKKAGDPTKAVKGMKNHGEVMKHKLENDDNVAESFKLPTSIAVNVNKIMEHVNKQIAKFPNGRKFTPQYRTVVELNGKQGRTQSTSILAEAAVDAEELAVIGKGNVALEVMLFEGKEQKGMFIVELPKLANRKPAMVAEGLLFRFPSIAKRVSETVIGESVVHKVVAHPFGALIKGDIEKLEKRW